VHELSIADSVVQIVCSHAGGRRVTAVELKVGHLRQVVPSALAFAFQLVAEGTVAEGAELHLEVVPAAGRCRHCGVESALREFPLRCTACGGWDLELLRGEELLVESLELELEEEALTMNGGTRHGD
jgi:hydrogenase nickel incorporation protein HypA/HybF